ncbi:hypothetical protein EK904_008057 [Melospiza melodia maxima]|nr:hypothetical protein EK904_008057 [Melospiza melodia maxima]
MPFSPPGPAFTQQGQQPVYPRERPVRPGMQPQGPVGILHFNQPGSATPRPFIPPRQQFLQAPGQPFLAPHTQPSMQSTPSQNIVKRSSQQLQAAAPRNSNLRELPIAPAHALDMGSTRRSSAPAAQYPDEDEETRLYRLKIEEQKRLREEILKQKELRRQQQAGARKRELLERLAQQQQQQQPCSQQPYQQHEEDSSEFPTNGSPYIPHSGLQTRHNVKSRLLVRKQDAAVANIHPKPTDFPQGAGDGPYQGQQLKPVKQLRQTRTIPASQPQAAPKVLPSKAATAAALPTARAAAAPGRPQEQKPGVKRTVMQRTNSASDGPHGGSKVRVIKLSGGGAEDAGFFHPEGQPQRPQQPPEPKQPPVRKVTLTKGMQQHQQQQQAQIHSPAPQGVKNIQGIHQAKKVIMHGRGRGVAGQMGRGRLMPNKQNLRVVECKPQPCIVSVEGLSSSTTDVQLKNLLMSVGPIQSLQMLPQQRKAIAKFKEPAHALAFQQKFHRHMIDLSHINVALIVE